MAKKGTLAKRASAIGLASCLAIALASCSGAKNNYGSLDKKAVYAQAGDYKVTQGDLWDEMKWDASEELENQITVVKLQDQIKKLELVMKNDYQSLSADDKASLEKYYSVTSIGDDDEEITEAEYKELYDLYKNKLIGYVIQDIHNLNWNADGYEDSVKDLSETQKKQDIVQYVDEVYTKYRLSTIDNEKLEDIINNSSYENPEGYFKIAKALPQIYYVSLAKEIKAYEKARQDAYDEFEDDTDSEDNTDGSFTHSDIISKFKSEKLDQYDIDMLMIRFTSDDEYKNTLRAFGLKVSSDKFYFVYDTKDVESTETVTYAKYIERYDELETSDLTNKDMGVEEVDSRAVLEIYCLLYNYVYGGYKDMVPSGYSSTLSNATIDLNSLRTLTKQIITDYTQNATEKYNALVNQLLDEKYKDVVRYTRDDLTDNYSDSFRSTCYDTLTLVDSNGNASYDERYDSSTHSLNGGYYIMYKFNDTYDNIEDTTAKSYEEFGRKEDLTDTAYYDYISENENLYNEMIEALIGDTVTESYITTTIDDMDDDVKVKIYNKATEISYSKDHTNYSKAVFGNSNSNVLATVKYDDGKTYNINIKADENDTKAITIPGTNAAYGVYDTLELSEGSTTAIDILTKQIIKNTKAYNDVKNDKSNEELYTTYINNTLTNFANGNLESNGYAATIGKYNFLMLYYHSADISSILKDYYYVQAASAKLLTDYSSDSLATFVSSYAHKLYDTYFSLEGTRLVVYMDKDEDNEADDTDSADSSNWANQEITFNGQTTTMEYAAKQLIYDIYNELSATTGSTHVDALTSLVEEINNSQRVAYEENPVSAENKWAVYRRLGLNVKTEEFSVTNSSTDSDFNLKQRLYDYARGYSLDAEGNKTTTYQYFINDSTPSEYIEPLTTDAVSTADDTIVETNDGYNLLIVTTGSSKASAKWSKEDYSSTLLENITLCYNKKFVTISDIYNDNDELNNNQIKLYMLDYAINGSSTISPSSTATAITNFLAPVITRYTADATQRIILLNFIQAMTSNTSTSLYNTITFTDQSYNGENGALKEIIEIAERSADSYSNLIEDTTNTSDIYSADWWTNLNAQVKQFLIDNSEEESK